MKQDNCLLLGQYDPIDAEFVNSSLWIGAEVAIGDLDIQLSKVGVFQQVVNQIFAAAQSAKTA